MSRESSVVSLKKSYRDLNVWRKSITLSKFVYKHTEAFPKREHFGLASQMRRAVVSIASNIAEGSARYSDKDYDHFITIARASIAELTTQFIISKEVGYIDHDVFLEYESQSDEISKILNGLRSRLTTQDS